MIPGCILRNTIYERRYTISSFVVRRSSFVGCFLFAVLLYGCQCQLHKDNRVLMGTFVEVASADKRAPEIVFAEIRRIEALLSKYKPESEISRLNKTGKIQASPETFYVIKKAKEFWQASGGAFDITVGPLVDLWGFTEKKYRLPDKESIAAALKLVGSDKIILNEENYMIEFKTQGMKVDLGAIAKGYVLDCASAKLKESGIKSCLINLGGQVYALGQKSARPWKMAIRDSRGKGFKKYLELEDKSIATSGDYEQYFIRAGSRYAHILDPKTGYPAESGIVSVTVSAPSGLIADALSTAIFVLGKEKGSVLAKEFPGTKIEDISENNDARQQ